MSKKILCESETGVEFRVACMHEYLETKMARAKESMKKRKGQRERPRTKRKAKKAKEERPKRKAKNK